MPGYENGINNQNKTNQKQKQKMKMKMYVKLSSSKEEESAFTSSYLARKKHAWTP